jgi:hypothetical protein
MTEISPNQTLRSFCFADRPFALKANLRLRVAYDSKSINITAGQTASHLLSTNEHVWQGLSTNIQEPHLVQRITGS